MNTYLIISETEYFMKKKIDEISKGIDNIITFNMEENTVDELLEEASYFSMFNDKKCLIVKNAKFLYSSKKEESHKAKEEQEKILKYLDNENKNTIIIFASYEKCDSKKKLYTKLKNEGNVFEYKILTKTEVLKELSNIVKESKYKIEDKSLWYIINSTLGNLDLCINELNKIMIYYSNPCMIKYEDVIKLVSISIEDNNFKLVDAIIKRDYSESLRLLKDFNTIKGEPNIIVSLLYREFKLMLSVHIYEKNKYSINDILKELHIVSWQYNKIKENLNHYSINEIKEEIINLSILDYKSKCGLIDRDLMLINYITCLC